MTKKSKTPSRKRQKIVEVVEEKDQEDEDVDITGADDDAEAPQADEGAGPSNKERKRRSDVGKPRMKIKSLKMKNDKRFVLVGKGWKELDPKKVIMASLFVYLSLCAQVGPLAIALFDSYRKDLIHISQAREKLDNEDDVFE